jgi:CheY-like chemotaxis protein
MINNRPITILLADDDADDRLMAADALEESRLANDLRFVEDGEELMDYLHRRDKYSEADAAPRPGLILLDLNMPRKDGREALREIKADPDLRTIPVVVLTSFITKPVNFESLVAVMRALSKYWFEIVELPA